MSTTISLVCGGPKESTVRQNYFQSIYTLPSDVLGSIKTCVCFGEKLLSVRRRGAHELLKTTSKAHWLRMSEGGIYEWLSAIQSMNRGSSIVLVNTWLPLLIKWMVNKIFICKINRYCVQASLLSFFEDTCLFTASFEFPVLMYEYLSVLFQIKKAHANLYSCEKLG